MLFWRILDRYVFFELIRVFGLCAPALTGILVMAVLVPEAAKEGLGPEQIIQLVPLVIPGTLPFTIPTTLLFAVSVVYGRLSADSEITAIKAAGIPVTRVIWPGLFLGAGLSLGVYFLYDEFIPYSYHRFKTAALNDIEELIYARLRRDLRFNEPKLNYAIFVKDVQGRRLIWPTFKKRDTQGQDEIVAMAREAEIQVDLDQGVVRVLMLQGEMIKDGGNTKVLFDQEMIPVPLPPMGAARQPRAREMSSSELLERMALVERRIAEGVIVGTDDKPLPRTAEKGQNQAAWDASLQFQKRLMKREVGELHTEFCMRPALSFGCLFFALIGCPVGIWFHRRDFLSAFVTSFLPIVVLYYPLLMFGINLGKEGRLEPLYAMWLGNALLGVIGLGLLWRLVRR